MAVATARLAPLGVTVLTGDAPTGFDLVLNRHGHLDAADTARVLRPGGTLLTQQVGGDDCTDLNAMLGAPSDPPPARWDASTAGAALTAAGFTLQDVREEHPALTFTDVGALVFHLRMVSWQIPGFTPARYDAALRRLHAAGPIVVHTHRFLIRAVR